MVRVRLKTFSFPGSAWERVPSRLCLVLARSALMPTAWRGRASKAVRSQAEPGNEVRATRGRVDHTYPRTRTRLSPSAPGRGRRPRPLGVCGVPLRRARRLPREKSIPNCARGRSARGRTQGGSASLTASAASRRCNRSAKPSAQRACGLFMNISACGAMVVALRRRC